MAQLYLSSQVVLDDLHRIPRGAAKAEKPAPYANESQLLAATGGTEGSCYRCAAPFGVVVLVAGAVVTAVAYAFNSHGSVISVLGLALLGGGLALLGSSALCWRLQLGRKRSRRRESQTPLVVGQEYCMA